MATKVQKQTKVTLVYDGLKRAILEGEYAPGRPSSASRARDGSN
jgi:DNA-binding GntR family transcriptional regulator